MRKLLLLALLTALVCVPARATQVNDILRYANGQPAAGRVTISWSTFTLPSGEAIPSGQISVDIVNGVLSVDLLPHNGYLVRYILSRGSWTSDIWNVPDSTASLTIAQLRPLPVQQGVWESMLRPWIEYTLPWESYTL